MIGQPFSFHTLSRECLTSRILYMHLWWGGGVFSRVKGVSGGVNGRMVSKLFPFNLFLTDETAEPHSLLCCSILASYPLIIYFAKNSSYATCIKWVDLHRPMSRSNFRCSWILNRNTWTSTTLTLHLKLPYWTYRAEVSYERMTQICFRWTLCGSANGLPNLSSFPLDKRSGWRLSK